MKKIVCLLLAALPFFTACHKDHSAPSNPAVDVYVAGEYNSLVDNMGHALYWKNGVPQPVENLNVPTAANAVEVNNGHVYMVGQSNGSPCIWKDGKETILKLPADVAVPGQANDLLIDNGIIYIVGQRRFSPSTDKAVVWQFDINNNQVTVESVLDATWSTAFSICKSGTKLYVCGEYPDQGMNYACYWNWEIGAIPPSAKTAFNANEPSTTYRILTYGQKTYTSGYKPQAAAASQRGYWELPALQENFHPFNISDATIETMAVNDKGSILFAGDLSETVNNVTQSYATLWQNGQPTRLSESISSAANEMALNGTDVYVLGYDPDQIWVWKSGKKTILTKPTNCGNLVANDILLAKK